MKPYKTIKTGALIFALVLLLCSCSMVTPQSTAYNETASLVPNSHTQAITSSNISSTQSKASTPKKQKSPSKVKTTSDKEVDFGLASCKLSYVLPKNYYYAARLNGKELAAYEKLKNALAKRTVGEIYMGDITEKQLRLIYTAVRDDYPEYFWIPSHYSYKKDSSDDIILVMADDEYTVSSSKRDEMADKLKTTISKIKSDLEKIAATDGHTVYDFEQYILNWLCKNVEYSDNNKDDLIYTAYGALVNGSAVCEGYARAASLMFNLAGIENGLVNGKGADGIGHLWNIVKINGAWYHFDATWADDENSPDAPYPFFFNLSDDEVTRDRTINQNLKVTLENVNDNFNFNLPFCSKSGKTYSAENLLILDTAQNLNKQILTALGNYLYNNKNPKNYFDVMVKSDTPLKTATDAYKQIAFKQIITDINRSFLLLKPYTIKEYTVSSAENGGFRIYLTFSKQKNGK